MKLLFVLTVTLVAMAFHVDAKSMDIKKLKAILVALEKTGGSDPMEVLYQGIGARGPQGPQGPEDRRRPEYYGPDYGGPGGPSGPQVVPEVENESWGEAVDPGLMEELLTRGRSLKKNCGIDVAAQFKEAIPVAATEIKAALTAAKIHTQGVLTNMEGHETKLVEVGALLAAADSTIPVVLQANSELLDQFNSTLTSTKEEAICVFGSLVALRIRMEVFGSTGFTGSGSCHATVSTLHTFLKANNYDLAVAKSKMDVGFVKELGTAVISDIKCLTSDLREFVDLVTQAEQIPATTKARHVAMMLDGITSYAKTMGRETQMLIEVVRGMVTIIPDVINQAVAAKDLLHHLAKANSKTDLGKLMDVLKIAMKLKQRR